MLLLGFPYWIRVKIDRSVMICSPVKIHANIVMYSILPDLKNQQVNPPKTGFELTLRSRRIMKKTHIIILVGIAVLIVALLAYSVDFPLTIRSIRAKRKAKEFVHMIARLDKSQPIEYDPINNPELSFFYRSWQPRRNYKSDLSQQQTYRHLKKSEAHRVERKNDTGSFWVQGNSAVIQIQRR